MNSLYGLIDKLKKIEEAGPDRTEPTPGAPTTFTPTHFHKGNLGNVTQLMQTPDGKFWYKEAGKYGNIVSWNSDGLDRGALNPGSVDGKIVNGQMIPFEQGTTWKSDAEGVAQAQTLSRSIQANLPNVTAPGTNKASTTDLYALNPAKVDASKLKTSTVPPASADANIKQYPPSSAQSASAQSASADANANIKQYPSNAASLAVAQGKTDGASASAPAAVTMTPEKITSSIARIKQIIGAVNEGVNFKSSIGLALLESFDLGLKEDAASDLAELNELWPQLLNWANGISQRGDPLAFEIKDLAPAVAEWQKAQASSAQPSANAPAAEKSAEETELDRVRALFTNNGFRYVTKGEAPQHWTFVKGTGYDKLPDPAPDPDIKKMQEFLIKAGIKIPDMKDGVPTDGLVKAIQAYMASKNLRDTSAFWQQVLGTGVASNSAQKVDAQPAAKKGLRPEVLALAKANGIANPNIITPGQEIKLPNGTSAVVDKGDTLNIIYDRYKAGGYDEGTPVASEPPPPAPAPAAVVPNAPVIKAVGASATSAAPSSSTSATSEVPIPPADAKPVDVNAYLNKVAEKALGKPIGTGDLFWVNGQLYSADVSFNKRIKRTVWKKDEKFLSGSAVNRGRVDNKYTGPDAGSETGASTDKASLRLAKQPVADARLQSKKGPGGETLYRLGDQSITYWDAKNQSYVPWDINKNEVIGTPLKLTDFKIIKESTGFTNDELNRIVSLVHHR
jgi:hypothetical protein